MRRLLIGCSLLLGLIFLSGCSNAEAELIIHNETGNRLWVTLGNNTTLLSADESLTDNYTLKKRKNFLSSVETKVVDVGITGETYRIWDNTNDEYVDETRLYLNADDVRHVYCNSNLACLKVINNADLLVNSIRYIKKYYNGSTSTKTEDLDPPLESGGEWYKPVDGYYSQPMYYEVQAFLSNGNTVTAGDSLTSSLLIGEIFTLIITDENGSGE